MRIQKNLSNLRQEAGQAHDSTHTAQDSKRILDKLKAMREQIGKEHLRIMHKDRGEVLAKTKIELLEVYEMQMAGRITLDNKQINELTTSSGTDEDDMSELSSLEEHQKDSSEHFLRQVLNTVSKNDEDLQQPSF